MINSICYLLALDLFHIMHGYLTGEVTIKKYIKILGFNDLEWLENLSTKNL